MEAMFLEARKKIKINDNSLKLLDELPEKIGIISTVQYLNLIPKIKEYLEKKGKKVFTEKGRYALHEGQILGCDVIAAEKVKMKVDCFLMIGSDYFHYSPALFIKKPLFIFSPEANVFKRIYEKEIEKLMIKKRAALMKFHHADKIGIIVSTKPGQHYLKSALELKKDLEKKGKKAFIFICDNLNIKEIENFDCKAWINTACPAMFMEPKILNIKDINLRY